MQEGDYEAWVEGSKEKSLAGGDLGFVVAEESGSCQEQAAF